MSRAKTRDGVRGAASVIEGKPAQDGARAVPRRGGARASGGGAVQRSAKGSRGEGGKGRAPGARRGGGTGWSASTADRHVLYTHAVQSVEAEIDFVDETFEAIRGRKARLLREDFCGTGATSGEWVRRRASNVAIGLDLDRATLDWGLEHVVGRLSESQRRRISLLQRDVREPGDATGVDVVLAMNFSYWIFKTRAELVAYFGRVHASLAPGGVFFCDHYGGWESMKEQKDKRVIKTRRGAFTYVWDQVRYEPITGDMECAIHFQFADGTRMRNAFTYSWRLWTLPELRELLAEAGFRNVTVYWEGDDDKGSGNGVFTPAKTAEQCPSFICYLTGER